MSKWIKQEKFEEFRGERESDNSTEKTVTYARRWKSPAMGSQQKPNEYHIRLLPDTDGNFYKKYFQHVFQSGESWNYIVCPKTHGMDNYCPWCAASQLLYQGSTADKKKAAQYKRREKYVGNVFVVHDPRDSNENDPEKKFAGKTFLYEFPSVVEQQIKKEVTDTENGWGPVIFDPEEGHNMLLRIGAKKPDPNGKVWPDYSQTSFTKKASSIADSEEEVETIMATVQSITEYLDNSSWSPDQHETLLKSEMLWDDVENDFLRHYKTEKKEEAKEETPDPDKSAHNENRMSGEDKAPPKETKKSEKKETKKSDVSQSDADLLAELQDL